MLGSLPINIGLVTLVAAVGYGNGNPRFSASRDKCGKI